MYLSEFEKIAPALLAAGTSMELQSSPGVGKSETVAILPDIMSKITGEEWGYGDAFLATYTPPDLLGYQFKGERKYGDKTYTVTDPSMPLWMQTADPVTKRPNGKCVFDFPRGILLLDEYGQAEGDVKRASAELLNSGRCGPWSLPKGWVVIACSNRMSDRSGVNKSFDFIINRRKEIHIDAHLPTWEEWAFKRGKVHPTYITFAVQFPQAVFEGKVPEKQGPWCTPRSLVKAQQDHVALMKHYGQDTLPLDSLSREIVTGWMGAGAAAQLFSMAELEEAMPKYEDIVKHPDVAKLPTKPDSRMLVCYTLASRVELGEEEPVVKYIERLPAEFSITFARSAVKRVPALINTATFGAWCLRNASLMTAVVDTK